MSQHDFDIANQSAPNFRSDLNNALGALASLSSGATAPSTTYANMLWYDTANNILKLRNEADDAWINVGYVNQGDDTFAVLEGTKIRNTSGTEVGTIGTGDFVLLETQTASASANLDFTAFDNSTYSTYVFKLDSLVPSGTNVNLIMRTSSDGGSTFASSAASYVDGSTGIELGADLFIGTSDAVSGSIDLHSAANAATKTYVSGQCVHTAFVKSTTNVFSRTVRDARNANEDTDAVRFLFTSGNITSGTIKMYGLV